MARPARDERASRGRGCVRDCLGDYWMGTDWYGAGPGAIAGGVAHGSHGLTGGQTGAQTGAHGSTTGAPRHIHRQQRQPIRLLVIISTDDTINTFFMIRISNQNGLVPSRSSYHVNSTPRLMMCKCNGTFFLKHGPYPSPTLRLENNLHLVYSFCRPENIGCYSWSDCSWHAGKSHRHDSLTSSKTNDHSE
jgi:hypothetical protein